MTLSFLSLLFAWNVHKVNNLINVIVEVETENTNDILLKNNNEYFAFKQFNNVLNQTIRKKINSLEILVDEKYKNKIKSIVIFNDTKMYYYDDFSKYYTDKEAICTQDNCKNYYKHTFNEEVIKQHKTKLSSFLDSISHIDKIFYPFLIFISLTIFFGCKLNLNKAILPVCILFLAVILRLNNINSYAPWGDECYSILISQTHLPFLNLFNDPGNPPFYFLVLRIFQYFSETILNFRLLSVFFSVFAGIFLFIFLKKNYSLKLANVVLFLYSINLPIIYFSQEIRSYSLQVLFAVLFLMLTFKILKESNIKNWIIYSILGMIAINAHYYQAIFIFANFLYLTFSFIKNKRKTDLFFLFGVNLIILLSFLPYYLITAHNEALLNSNFNTQLPKITTDLVKDCFYYIFGGFFPLILSILFFLNKKLEKKRKELLFYCIWIIFAVVILGIILSLLIRPMLAHRYILFLIPYVLIVLGVISIYEYKNKSLLVLFVICLIFAQNYSKNSFSHIRMKKSQSYNTFQIAKEYSEIHDKKVVIIAKPSDVSVMELNKIDNFETIIIPPFDSYQVSEQKIKEIKKKNKNAVIFTSLLRYDKNTLKQDNHTCYFNSALDLCIWKID